METKVHQQTAASAALATARSGTTYNAIAQAVGEFVKPDRGLVQAASRIVAMSGEFEQVYAHLGPFYPIFGSRHVWVRAFEILDQQLKNPQTTLNRLNRLHRSMTGSSATIEVDVPITTRSKRSLAPHIVAILKKVLVSQAPEVKLPRYVTDLRSAVARGHQAQLLASLSEHFHDYRLAWAQRYEDWARVYALAGGHRADSVKYGAVAIAFRSLTVHTLLSPSSGFIDGANVKSSYLYHMAADYARKRKLSKPVIPTAPVGSASEYAEMLDRQYRAEIPFVDCEEFARSRLEMFASDLALDIEPRTPLDDEPEIKQEPAGKQHEQAISGQLEEPRQEQAQDTVGEGEEFDMDALDALLGGGGVSLTATLEQVEATYTGELTPDMAAKANGYNSFREAYEALGEKARFDPETEFTQTAMASLSKDEDMSLDAGIAID